MSSEKEVIINEIIEAAAALSETAYDTERKALAKEAGFSRIGTFDRLVVQARQRLRRAQMAARREGRGTTPQEPLALDEKLDAAEFPFLTEKGRPVDHGDNVTHMLDRYGFRMYYDANLKKGVWSHQKLANDTDNADNRLISVVRSLCSMNDVPACALDLHLSAHYEKNQRAPVAEYLSKLEWDGTSRFHLFGRALNSSDPGDMLAACVRVFLLQACAAADGAKAGIAVREALGKFTVPAYEYVLVLHSPQGAGKTKQFLSLLPRALRKDYSREGVILDTRDKDSQVNAVSAWITELGELDATFKKSDVVAFKAWVSRMVDRIRLPYARAASALARRAVFFGTVNDPQYLRDTTGNRRFLPVTCGVIRPDLAAATIDQIWAEAWHRYAAGEAWWPDSSEEKALAHATEQRRERTPLEEVLADMFDWSAGYAVSAERHSVTAIINTAKAKLRGDLLREHATLPSRQELRDCADALRSLWRNAQGVDLRDDGTVYVDAVDTEALKVKRLKAYSDVGRSVGWLLPPGEGNECRTAAAAVQRRIETRLEQERREEEAAAKREAEKAEGEKYLRRLLREPRRAKTARRARLRKV